MGGIKNINIVKCFNDDECRTKLQSREPESIALNGEK